MAEKILSATASVYINGRVVYGNIRNRYKQKRIKLDDQHFFGSLSRVIPFTNPAISSLSMSCASLNQFSNRFASLEKIVS